ncbi:MAG: mannosyltransferase [Flavobacterium sp.]|nr:mannosyltransferase [Flavobacterium sp.]
MNLSDKRYHVLFFVALSLLAYWFLGYLVPRENFFLLFGFYSIAFISFYYLYNASSISEKELFGYGVFFRGILLFCLPFWSQDVYRFIWDGRVVYSGLSPYEFKPDAIIHSVHFFQSHELYEKMGSLSASHFSNYPPVNQFIFLIAALFASKSIFLSVFIFKSILFFADIGIYHYGKKMMVELGFSTKNIFLYFLNPLIIVELVGNAHFEGVMLFLLVLGVYCFFTNKLMWSALFIALSISTKLLPLLLLPFFYQKLGFKKSVVFYVFILLINYLLFLPFVSESLVQNYSQTIALWFINFEFNASFYYVFRAIGYWFVGYNVIGVIGKIIPVFSVLILLYYALFRNNVLPQMFFKNALFGLLIYFLVSTTIHPWYIVNLLFLSMFTKYKFILVWTLTVILSYFTYSQDSFQENMVLIFLEYTAFLGFLGYEIYRIKKAEKPFKQAESI